MQKIFFKLLFLLLTITFFNLNCKSTSDKEDEPESFEDHFIKAQDFSNRGKYKNSLEIYFIIQQKFPETEVLAVNYNIGYNYYRLENFEKARIFLNRVIEIYESNSKSISEEFLYENQKYIRLSEVINKKIDEDIAEKKDPYHIKDDMEKNKKIKPKNKKVKIEKQ